jgi:putative ABC transport system ATP-binding protein
MEAAIESSVRYSVRLQGIDKSFHNGSIKTPVLKKVDLDARQGEMLFLVGPSGSGKTTLLSVLCGTLQADGGEIHALGQPLHTMGDRLSTRFRARHVGFIFQQFNLIPTISAGENAAVPLIIQGKGRKAAMEKSRELMAKVGLSDQFDKRPAALSGGQQQRVAIARALVHDPELVVCDEPTSALDSENGHAVMELLRGVAAVGGRTVIVVTHDHRIYQYADRMAEMEDGRISRVLESQADIATAHNLN